MATAGLIIGLGAAGCADSSLLPPSDDKLSEGTWGGDNAGVIVTELETHVHVGCTFGNVAGEIPLDASGRFTVDGSYVLRAYPVQIGPELPAQFSGRVVGNRLTLAIAVNDTVEGKVVSLGPITVVYGREPEMGPCPICRRKDARAQRRKVRVSARLSVGNHRIHPVKSVVPLDKERDFSRA